MISVAELRAALRGVRGLIRFDLGAFQVFDASHAGFWKSFWAAVLMAPFAGAMVARQIEVAPPDSVWRFVAFQFLGYIIGWLAFPLIMVRIADLIGRGDRYFAFMVPYNWFHLAAIMFWAPLVILSLARTMPPAVEGLLSLMIVGVLLGYEWYIARNALRIGAGTAAALVAIDFLLSLVIDRLSDTLP